VQHYAVAARHVHLAQLQKLTLRFVVPALGHSTPYLID
jgi:hypothetical protein